MRTPLPIVADKSFHDGEGYPSKRRSASIPFNINYLSGHKLLTRFAARIASAPDATDANFSISLVPVSLRLRLL